MPSAHDHFVEPSGIGSTFAAALASAAGLRLIRRRAGAGRFATAFLAVVVVVVASAASALVVASMPDRDRAPTTLAIRSLFINDSLSKFRLSVQSGRLQRQFGGEMTACIDPFCESTRADLAIRRTQRAIFAYLEIGTSDFRDRCNLRSAG